MSKRGRLAMSQFGSSLPVTHPWHEVRVEEVLSCRHGRFNGYLPYGRS